MSSGIWDTDLQNSPYIIQGNWNANTNTPDLTSVTTLGYAWIVSVPGSFNLGGITTWNTNDIAVKTPSGWARITPASATWGTITGTLANQTDLQNQLNLKATKDEALYESAGIYVEPSHVKARLRRIASTGTAPSANPFCEMLQLHIEQDTTGSRLITTK